MATDSTRSLPDSALSTSELSRLVSTAELQRLLESQRSEAHSISADRSRSWHGNRESTPVSARGGWERGPQSSARERAASTNREAHMSPPCFRAPPRRAVIRLPPLPFPRALAQFGLSSDEVQRWLAENAPGSELPFPTRAAPAPRGPSLSFSASVSAPNRFGLSSSTSSCSAYTTPQDMGMAPPSRTSSGGSQSWLGQARRRLDHFEDQVRWVAKQAAALRNESQRLKSDGLVDASRLEELQRLLLTSVEGLTIRERNGHDCRSPVRKQPRCNHDIYTQQAVVSCTAPVERVAALPLGLATVSAEEQNGTVQNRRRNHKQEQLKVLIQWFDAHESEPYPTTEEKRELSALAGMEVRQVEHWFTNRRKRHWRLANTKGADMGADEA